MLNLALAGMVAWGVATCSSAWGSGAEVADASGDGVADAELHLPIWPALLEQRPDGVPETGSDSKIDTGPADAGPADLPKSWRPTRPMRPYFRPLSRIGFGAKVGTLGIGLEVATPLLSRTNLRFTGNFFDYTDSSSRDGFLYSANLNLRSVEVSLDIFPFRGGFHISPGYYFLGQSNVSGHTSVPGAQTFTLNGIEYRSSMSDPIKGSGKATVNDSGPVLTVGWGSLLSRVRRFSFPFEVGGIYQGSPRIALNLGGSACDSSGVFCQKTSFFPGFQQSVDAEVVKANKDAEPYKFFPIVSIGFALNF